MFKTHFSLLHPLSLHLSPTLPFLTTSSTSHIFFPGVLVTCAHSGRSPKFFIWSLFQYLGYAKRTLYFTLVKDFCNCRNAPFLFSSLILSFSRWENMISLDKYKYRSFVRTVCCGSRHILSFCEMMQSFDGMISYRKSAVAVTLMILSMTSECRTSQLS